MSQTSDAQLQVRWDDIVAQLAHPLARIDLEILDDLDDEVFSRTGVSPGANFDWISAADLPFGADYTLEVVVADTGGGIHVYAIDFSWADD